MIETTATFIMNPPHHLLQVLATFLLSQDYYFIWVNTIALTSIQLVKNLLTTIYSKSTEIPTSPKALLMNLQAYSFKQFRAECTIFRKNVLKSCTFLCLCTMHAIVANFTPKNSLIDNQYILSILWAHKTSKF